MMRALLHGLAIAGPWLWFVAGLAVVGAIARAFILAPPTLSSDNRTLAARLADSKERGRVMDVVNARGRAK